MKNWEPSFSRKREQQGCFLPGRKSKCSWRRSSFLEDWKYHRGLEWPSGWEASWHWRLTSTGPRSLGSLAIGATVITDYTSLWATIYISCSLDRMFLAHYLQNKKMPFWVRLNRNNSSVWKWKRGHSLKFQLKHILLSNTRTITILCQIYTYVYLCICTDYKCRCWLAVSRNDFNLFRYHDRIMVMWQKDLHFRDTYLQIKW